MTSVADPTPPQKSGAEAKSFRNAKDQLVAGAIASVEQPLPAQNAFLFKVRKSKSKPPSRPIHWVRVDLPTVLALT